MTRVDPELLVSIYERASPSLGARLLLASRPLHALVSRYATQCSTSLAVNEDIPAPPDSACYPNVTRVVLQCSVAMLRRLFPFDNIVTFATENFQTVKLVYNTPAAFEAKRIGAVEGVSYAYFTLRHVADMWQSNCVTDICAGLTNAGVRATPDSWLEGRVAHVGFPHVRSLALDGMLLPEASCVPHLRRLDLVCSLRSPNAVVCHPGLREIKLRWTAVPGLVSLPSTITSLDIGADAHQHLTLHPLPDLQHLWVSCMTINCNLLLGMPALRHLFLKNAWLDNLGPEGLLHDIVGHGQLRTMQLTTDRPTSLDRETWSRLIRLPTPGLEGLLRPEHMTIVWTRRPEP